MKTVSGKVVSSNSVSLLKAAKYLSQFAASDNEASPAFAAYLRRTSAAFNELVKMHKEYKIPLGLVRVRGEDHSEGVVTRGTAQSVELGAGYMEVESTREGKKCKGGYRQSDLSVDESSKDMRDEVEERRNVVTSEMEKDAQSSGGIIDGAVVNVGGGGKISKKRKKLGNETLAVIYKDQENVDCDTVVGIKVKNDMGSLDGNEELMNIKKSKRDKHGKKSGNAGLEIRNEVKQADDDGDVAEPVQNNDVMQKQHRKKNKPSGDGDLEIGKEVQQADDVAQSVQNNGDTQKKHKSKVKREQENSSINNAENKDNGNSKNKVKIEREHGSINEMVTVDGSEDVKKKRDKHVKGNSDGALDAGKEVHVEDVAVQNNDDKRKKHKNKTNTRKIDGIVKGGVMEKKEPTAAADEKASKKRKHDEVASGGLDGSPQEVITKKKKNRH